MQASKAPDTIDAESFRSNMTLIAELFPTMPEASVRRASWAIAKSKMSLKAAVAAEGFALDGDTRVAAPAPKAAPAPPPAPPTAAQAAELADLRFKIHALRDAPAPDADAATAVERVNAAAIAAMKRDPKLTYYKAVSGGAK